MSTPKYSSQQTKITNRPSARGMPVSKNSADLVEYKSESVSAAGVKLQNSPICDGSPTVTSFTSPTPTPNDSAGTVAKAIIDRLIGIFGPPQILRPDQGPEFENEIVSQLQSILG